MSEDYPFMRPLIPLSIAFMLGIGLGAAMPDGFMLVLPAVVAMAAAIAWALWTRRSALVLPLLFSRE